MASVDDTKNVTVKVIIDFILLAISPIPSLIFKVAVQPFKRGFFCNDESIKHPYLKDTIPLWIVIVVGMVVPCILMVPIELFRYRRWTQNRDPKASPALGFTCFGRHVHPYFVQIYKAWGPFLFAMAVCQVSTDIIKYSLGRLRPHFLTICAPNYATLKCQDDFGNFIFITDDVCTQTEHIKEGRLSHPSGHASQSLMCAVYFGLYLQSRFKWRGSRLLRYFIQVVLIYAAVYVCVSRISDYKHHWSDVLGGGVLGIVVALMVAYFVSDLFPRPKPRHVKRQLTELQTFFEKRYFYSDGEQQQQQQRHRRSQEGEAGGQLPPAISTVATAY